MKTWLADLESKQADFIAKQLEKEVAEKKLAEERAAEVEKQTREAEAKAVQSAESLPGNSKKKFPIWGTVSTGTFVTLATLSTFQTHTLYQEINASCDLFDGKGFCTSTIQDNDLLTQFEQSQTTSLILWGTSIAGVGLTIWQSTKPVQVHMTQRGFMIGGHF